MQYITGSTVALDLDATFLLPGCGIIFTYASYLAKNTFHPVIFNAIQLLA